MRLFLVWHTLALLMLTVLRAAEPVGYPLWDGQEPISVYANRIQRAPTRTLELGNGLTLELVLIPAGRFLMGTPVPVPVDEVDFHKKILTGQILLGISLFILLLMLGLILSRALRQKRRPQLSLGLLVAVTVTAGGCVLSGMHWLYSAEALELAQNEFAAAKARFDVADLEEKPAHTVTLTKPFYLGSYTVTQRQYQALTGQNWSRVSGKDHPVESVSWNGAQVFCANVSQRTKLSVRLPTEAEWEFACRAGTKTAYYFGDSESALARSGWYSANSSKSTQPVGLLAPNAFGLYDMHGNVLQWCQDWYGADYYKHASPENPQGPSPEDYPNLLASSWRRVLRGSSFDHRASRCRTAARDRNYPVNCSDNVGFRVVLELE